MNCNFEGYSFKKLTDKEKIVIAELVAADTLEGVNEKCKPVDFHETIYTKYIKRILDIVISLPACIITLPINIILLCCTFFDVGRPILFFQTRIGKGLRTFPFGKFRNMNEEKDENGVLLPAAERVTKWGLFVRKTSLDELLNFWYILIGKMSIIGPRPMPDEYLNRFNSYHIKRHLVRPGLECPLHSEQYIGGMTWQNRFDNDIWYVENVSFKTDVYIFSLLVKDALISRRREQRAKAEIGTFIGYTENGEIIDSNEIPEKYYTEIFARRK